MKKRSLGGVVDNTECCATVVGYHLFHDMSMIQDDTIVLLQRWESCLMAFTSFQILNRYLYNHRGGEKVR